MKALRNAACFLLLASVLSLGQPGPSGPDRTVDAAVRDRVIQSVLSELDRAYVFPEVAKKMETSLRERQKKGEYDGVTSAAEFARKLTADLQAVSFDKHLRVRHDAPPLPSNGGRPSPEEVQRQRLEMARRNFGFERVERLQGNIGYLDLRGFNPATLGGETAVAAMNFLAHTDALIIDLRQNGGGDPAMVALITSYLFGPDTVHLNDLYFRPRDETRQWWTLPHVPGRRFGPDKPVFVLTSKRTFSAAEEFTYNLKNLKRATIVGENTGGGAHPGGFVPLGDGFGAFIPSGRAINPISKKNWEGDGVSPDVPVPAAQALSRAKVLAVEKLHEKETDPARKQQLQSLLEETRKEEAGKGEPRKEPSRP